jgi:uncharacterized protein
MILETLVATLDAAGRPNVAPMGIVLDGDTIVLRPFRGAATWRNLEATGCGVVQFTDNVLLFARSALASEVPPHGPASAVRGIVLDDAAHWREFVVASSDLAGERATFRARVVAGGRRRDLLVFNRAQHAVIEATILATRVHLTGAAPVLEEIARLRPLVDRTGGPREREAFAFVTASVEAMAHAPAGGGAA